MKSPRGGRSKRWLKRMRFYVQQRKMRAIKRGCRHVVQYMMRDFNKVCRDMLLVGRGFMDGTGRHIPLGTIATEAPIGVYFLSRDGFYLFEGTEAELRAVKVAAEQVVLYCRDGVTVGLTASPAPADTPPVD